MYKKNSHKRTKIVLLLAIVLIGYFWYRQSRYNYFINTPVDPSDNTKVSFLIKDGDEVNEIAKTLEDKNLILNGDAFKTYLKSNNLDRKIVAGRFFLLRSQTTPQIAEILNDNSKSQSILTVPEGSTIADIDKKLVDLGLIKEGEFVSTAQNYLQTENAKKYSFLDPVALKTELHPLEGYLFPDTYFLNPNSYSNEDLIQLMLTTFKKKALPELNKAQGRTIHEALTMASIIEKEARTAKDLPIISGILWKRLDQHWQLGADATLLYLKADRTIDFSDLKEDSPYNTRKKTGLPPGPICSPGLNSILAAVNPTDSQYFYYLTKPDSGEVVYAVTNDEQNRNKARYLN